MDHSSLIGALAIFTLGAVLVLAIVYFGFFLKASDNKNAAKNVARGGKSATTKLAEDAPSGSYHDANLKERLDGSLSSKHPLDPEAGAQGIGA